MTPFRALHEVLTEYARTLRDVLGNDLVGLYPVGSLAVGDFDATSDVDFLVVVATEPTAAAVDHLRPAHLDLASRDTRLARHLEYSVFPLQTLSRRSSPYGPNRHDDSAGRLLWYFPTAAATSSGPTTTTRW